MPLWSRGRQGGDDEVAVLRRELDRFQQENMRLRLERQRPLSLVKLAHELKERHAEADDLVQLDISDSVDEAYHVLAQAEAMRRSVLDAVDGLSVAAIQLRRQLTTDVPLSEIDRRVAERRDAARAESTRVTEPVEGSSDRAETPAAVAPSSHLSKPKLETIMVNERALIDLAGAGR